MWLINKETAKNPKPTESRVYRCNYTGGMGVVVTTGTHVYDSPLLAGMFLCSFKAFLRARRKKSKLNEGGQR